jgi:hypothetical protein
MFLSFTGMGREVHAKILNNVFIFYKKIKTLFRFLTWTSLPNPVKDKNIVQNLNMYFPTHPCKR